MNESLTRFAFSVSRRENRRRYAGDAKVTGSGRARWFPLGRIFAKRREQYRKGGKNAGEKTRARINAPRYARSEP